MDKYKDYYGRWFVPDQLSAAEKEEAFTLWPEDPHSCLRCNAVFQEEWHLPNGSYYCRECILLGRVRSDQPLYYFPQIPFEPQEVLEWKGKLTPFQQDVSDGLCEALEKKEPSLVHAVTGAGKTEMIYQVLAQVVRKGGSVCIASPRIDVCIELHKRLKKDFSCPVALLHGSSESYFRTPIVVATTHQLLKFYQAFDLVIIDEVDAFPYVDNPVLYHAVTQAIKTDGLAFYLTATSTEELDRKIKNGDLNRLSLPRRFHGNPLVVPSIKWCHQFTQWIEKGKLPSIVRREIQKQRKTNWPLLIFAPQIKIGEDFAALLQSAFPNEAIGFVSSLTANRLEIVESFRAHQLDILVSTTILERGVTFPGVDVMVVGTEDKVYTSSSLIQIAGRAGRSMDRPTGEVLFLSEGCTKAMRRAIEEIKKMNQEAGHV